MRGILVLVILALTMIVAATLLWRRRTRSTSHLSAQAESYWDAMKERRKFVRFKERLAVDCVIPEKSGSKYGVFSKDISGEGICLQIPEMLPGGSVLDLRINMPDKRPLVVRGEVVWVKESVDEPGLEGRFFNTGIRFTKIEPADKERLANFLDQKLKENI